MFMLMGKKNRRIDNGKGQPEGCPFVFVSKLVMFGKVIGEIQVIFFLSKYDEQYYMWYLRQIETYSILC